MGLPILYIKGSQVAFSKFRCIRSLDVVLIFANSADPDEMQQYAAFPLGLHCLPMFPVALERIKCESR